MEDNGQTEWEARRAQEKAWLRGKLEHIVGLIARLGQERDEVQRNRTSQRLVDEFMAFTEGPPPRIRDEV